MTLLLSKVLLTILMLPLAAVLYISLFIFFERPMRDSGALMMATVATGAFVACYWLRLWRDSVRWTPQRAARTGVLGLGSIVVGCILAAVSMIQHWEEELFILLAGLWIIALWLPGTVLLWRETPAEKAQRIREAAANAVFCLKCGYNMTGLYEARCPECGERFTLDQLLTGQAKETLERASGSK